MRSKNISINTLRANAKEWAKEQEELKDSEKKKKELYEAKEWYTIRALLGNQWANWFIMAGARER